MSERVNVERLRALTEAGWGDDLLMPKSIVRLLCDELEAVRTALDRIANMTDRDGNAIEMHREELRGIAKAALLAAKEKKS